MARINAYKTMLCVENQEYLIEQTIGVLARTNIHFSATTPPSDTNKLWVKTDVEPTKVMLKNQMSVTEPNVFNPLEVSGTKKYNWTPCVYVDGKFYFVVGQYATGSSYGMSFYLYSFDPSVTPNVCSYVAQIYTDSTSSYAYTPALVAIGNKIWFICAGTSSSTLNTIIFDLETRQITEKSPLTMNISGYDCTNCRAVAYGTKIFIFGGAYRTASYSDFQYKFDSFVVYDTELEEYVFQKSSSQSANTSGGCEIAIVGNYIYNFYQKKTGSSGNAVWYFCVQKVNLSTYESEEIILRQGVQNDIWTNDYHDFGVVGNLIYLKYRYYLYKFDTTDNSFVSTDLDITYLHGIMTHNTDKIYCVSEQSGNSFYVLDLTINLNNRNLLIVDDSVSNTFNLINQGNLQLDAHPRSVYLGDSNNEGQYVESALYDAVQEEWVNI